MSKSRRAPDESSDARPQKTRLRYRARCPDCDFSRTKRDRGDAYSLQASGCPNCDRGLGVSKVRPASTWYDDEDEDGDDSPEYDECGSTDTFDGEPCEQPAGLGTEHDDGPCHYHRDDGVDVDRGDGPVTDGGRDHRSPAVLEALLKERERENERLLELARDGMRLQAELPSIIAEVADACRETETRVYDCPECRTLWRATDGLDACPECEYPSVSKRRVRDVTEGDE